MIPWTEKHRPQKLKEVVGNFEAKKKIFDFVKNFSMQKKKAILVYGPAGSGKTTIAYALASEFKYEIIGIMQRDNAIIITTALNLIFMVKFVVISIS